jgi:hypothetical protein
MRIDVADDVTLTDPGDFRAFSLCSALAADVLAERLSAADAGYPDGGVVWVSVTWLRAQLDRAYIDASGAQLEAMLAFAASRGWIDAAGTHVRAHLHAD